MHGITLCARLFRPHPSLACKLLAVFLPPPGGRLLRQSLVVRDSADFLVRLRSRTEQIRTAEGSLPPGGEGGAKRRMRAKQASVAHNAAYHPASASLDGGMRYAVRSNNGDPACWRPAWGAGFDCAALFGCVVRPYTRCAASLRMTRGLQGRGTKYVRCKI